jgi:predicted ATP-grasp superfamily ATP-dependent carboligase
MPSHHDILRALDKDQTTRLAAQLGVTIPRTWSVGSAEEARQLAMSVPYPVVLKPQSSEELSSKAGTRTAGRPLYASNAEQFVRAYADISQRASTVLVQEFIPGGGTGYFALMCHGELRAEFAHRRIRDVHPTGSGSALRESTNPDPRVKEASLAILRALNWHGAAMVEFRMRPDGTPVFLEVNGRFWNSLPLACYAGVDFPGLVAQIAEHGDVAPAFGYRTGVRCRWFLGDFRHLLAVWAGPPEGYPGTFPNRWKTLASVMVPVPGTYHDNFQLADPLPELGDWLSMIARARSRSRQEGSTNA